ncbi:U32 family peptidase [Chitiniphilus purpureus]|uniref:U32 family peptidase n=1 Tax=Chitiniphilus purpureus TaxID=2981137 RepID=A0ABY6DPE7_9NEIS|nr:U32 family peptidase [Chitiniphilus sp. CD1]UXY15563.1 U32 family peptidase [Chitiniphilus sp. CD1]
MSLPAHHLELLAPARTVEIGREAILHGADAVYIGGPTFGARHNACNEVDEIAGLVRFAHRYHSRIFVTLNTILHDSELEPARRLIHQLYDAGVDALIVQDMGLLELDLPPIQLHASTQCDIRTPEKARFLADSGFSQVVLARELALPQIRAVRQALTDDTTIEFFIHGALCVAYSGQCYISHADTGRSANRGDCSQACRLPYTLTDNQGRVVAYDKHLLSMKDNDQSANLEALIDAGVRSFKIEGRYKDMGYVKNITAHYRLLLDGILERRPELARAASGSTEIFFTPDVDKNFHRGHTDYFVNGREGGDVGAFDSPKYIGVALGHVTRIGPKWFELEANGPLANGDGLNYMKKREVVGLQANTVEAVGAGKEGGIVWRVFPNEPMGSLDGLKVGLSIHRNRDHAWERALTQKSSDRRIAVWFRLSETPGGLALTVTDEDGASATATVDTALEPAKDAARSEAGLREGLARLGNTLFVAHGVALDLTQPWFVPNSTINALRREVIDRLDAARIAAWTRPPRKAPVEPPVAYPEKALTYLANVYNQKARDFYSRHGVELIAAAYEAHQEPGEVSVMITKHCLRFSYNLCPKQAKGVIGVKGQVRAEPMTLKSGNETYTLKFDCKPCEMHVIGRMKPHILKSAPPSTVVAQPITFHRSGPLPK